jgi:hypothetical protein
LRKRSARQNLSFSTLLEVKISTVFDVAAFLRETISTSSIEIDQTSFAEAVLAPAAFDLGVAATSFHWLEQTSALSKVYRSLKPSGWWAMWWTHFGSDEPDAFQRRLI